MREQETERRVVEVNINTNTKYKHTSKPHWKISVHKQNAPMPKHNANIILIYCAYNNMEVAHKIVEHRCVYAVSMFSVRFVAQTALHPISIVSFASQLLKSTTKISTFQSKTTISNLKFTHFNLTKIPGTLILN